MDDTDVNPREAMGGNNPPSDAELLSARLEREHAELASTAASIELRAFALPEKPATDEECATLVSFVADAKALVKKAEGSHTTEKAPFLSQGRVVDSFFKSIWTPMEARISANEARISAFMRAKAEKERQDRLAKEREERDRAEAARLEAAKKEREAREAEEAAAAAAEKLRQAATPEERQEVAAELNDAEQTAAAARAGAKDATKEAAAAERVGDAHGRAATGSVGKLGKVTGTGAGTAHGNFWNHRIKDAAKLIASLGPLGPHFGNDAIIQAIGSAKREAVAAKTIESLAIPGVEFFEDSKTTVRQARA